MIRINIVPPEFKLAAKRKQQVAAVIIMGNLVVLSLLGFWGMRKAHATKLKDEIGKLKRELAQLETVVNQIKAIEAQRNSLRNRVNVISSLNEKRLLYPIFFEDFMTVLPSGVWATSVQTTTRPQGLSLTIAARASNNFAIANWLENMEASPYFSNIRISGIAISKSRSDQQTNSFNLQCLYSRAAKAGK